MKIILFSGGDFPVLNISQIGYSDDVSVTHYGPARRDFHIIHYILRGKGYFNGNPVNAGEGFLIRPGDYEEYHADMEEPWEFLWVISDDTNMEKIFKSFSANDKRIFKFDYIPALYELVHRMRKMKKNILSRCELLELFLELLNHNERREVLPSSSAEKLYTDIASNYVKENIQSEITVNALAEILGVSRPYLYKIFVSTFGKSPKKYINEIRISRAKQLLKDSDVSISEVGISVGYPDALSFSKFFSSKVGLSPTDYRKNAKTKEDA